MLYTWSQHNAQIVFVLFADRFEGDWSEGSGQENVFMKVHMNMVWKIIFSTG